MAEILVVAVASAVTSGISISAAFVMVGTWLGVDNSTSSDDDGVKKSIQKSKLETKIDWNNCSSSSSSSSSNSSSTASVISLDDSEDSFKDETDR